MTERRAGLRWRARHVGCATAIASRSASSARRRSRSHCADGLREIELSLPASLEEFLESRRARCRCRPTFVTSRPRRSNAIKRSSRAFPAALPRRRRRCTLPRSCSIEIEKAGIEIVRLSLNVGLGTFRPVPRRRLDEHVMHAEAYAIDARAAAAHRASPQRAGRRIVAAGTTVVRALEGNFTALMAH